jgi:hypothetical protein
MSEKFPVFGGSTTTSWTAKASAGGWGGGKNNIVDTLIKCKINTEFREKVFTTKFQWLLP